MGQADRVHDREPGGDAAVAPPPGLAWLAALPERVERLVPPEPYDALWFEVHVNPSGAQRRQWRALFDAADGDPRPWLCTLLRGWSLEAPLTVETLWALPDELVAWLVETVSERLARPLRPPAATPSAPGSGAPPAPSPGRS